jgi:hypothetical protein
MNDFLSEINNIIRETYISMNNYKLLEIYNSNDLHICSNALETIIDKLNTTPNNEININKIKEDLSILFKSYGTNNIEDLLYIVYDSTYIDKYMNDENKEKFNSILKYVRPNKLQINTLG